MKITSFHACLCLTILLLSSAAIEAEKRTETDWKPPLAEGGAPECPDHVGSRTLRSETVSNGAVQAVIVGTAVRAQNKTCHSNANLTISGKTQTIIPLPGVSDHGFSIVDFAPDGKSLLLSSEGEDMAPNWDLRNVFVAVIPFARNEVHLVNTWDIFKWGNCYATVEPQGFTADGKVIILARPSVVYADRNDANCVSDWGLYVTDLAEGPVRLPDEAKVPRFGKVVTDRVQACKTDPDIIGACFTVHGRLSAWNGSPTMRIWRVGTKRILGDHDDWPLPEELAEQMNWDVEAWGDFEVCPFTKERPGVMQMVCIESASHIVYKKR